MHVHDVAVWQSLAVGNIVFSAAKYCAAPGKLPAEVRGGHFPISLVITF